jgi:hypothetical protein
MRLTNISRTLNNCTSFIILNDIINFQIFGSCILSMSIYVNTLLLCSVAIRQNYNFG